MEPTLNFDKLELAAGLIYAAMYLMDGESVYDLVQMGIPQDMAEVFKNQQVELGIFDLDEIKEWLTTP